MSRRSPLGPAAAVAAFALLAASCAAGGPSDGWHTLERGDLSVDVMDSWTEPDLAGQHTGMFDVVLQDTDDFDAEDTGVRLIATSDYTDSFPPVTPSHDARDALEYVVVMDPFGMAHPELPDPVRVDGRDGDEVWRQDVPRGPEGDMTYLWAAHDEASGRTVVVGLAGRAVTGDMVKAVDRSIAVVKQ